MQARDDTNLDSREARPKDARVTERVILRYDEFGWRSLESEAARDGKGLEELLGRALAHLDTELRTTRGALLAPRFKPGGHGTPREVRLELARAHLQRLEREAGRQGIPLERLLEHAPLLYLADVDSGRVPDR